MNYLLELNQHIVIVRLEEEQSLECFHQRWISLKISNDMNQHIGHNNSAHNVLQNTKMEGKMNKVQVKIYPT